MNFIHKQQDAQHTQTKPKWVQSLHGRLLRLPCKGSAYPRVYISLYHVTLGFSGS